MLQRFDILCSKATFLADGAFRDVGPVFLNAWAEPQVLAANELHGMSRDVQCFKRVGKLLRVQQISDGS
jgi:hypothetical protein